MISKGNVNLIIVTGLPGSGKTILIESYFEQRLSRSNIFDDFHANALENSSVVEKARCYSSLMKKLKEGEDCLVSDIEFCQQSRRKMLIQSITKEIPLLICEYHCFQNQPERCIKNVIIRNQASVSIEIGKIKSLSSVYNIPVSARVYDVWEQ